MLDFLQSDHGRMCKFRFWCICHHSTQALWLKFSNNGFPFCLPARILNFLKDRVPYCQWLRLWFIANPVLKYTSLQNNGWLFLPGCKVICVVASFHPALQLLLDLVNHRVNRRYRQLRFLMSCDSEGLTVSGFSMDNLSRESKLSFAMLFYSGERTSFSRRILGFNLFRSLSTRVKYDFPSHFELYIDIYSYANSLFRLPDKRVIQERSVPNCLASRTKRIARFSSVIMNMRNWT